MIIFSDVEIIIVYQIYLIVMNEIGVMIILKDLYVNNFPFFY